MRIGIVPVLDGHGGGRYQYSLTMLHALRRLAHSSPILRRDQFTVFAREMEHPLLPELQAAGWGVRPLYPNRLEDRLRRAARRVLRHSSLVSQLRARGALAGQARVDTDTVRYRPRVARWLRRAGCELMLYPSPDALAFETGLPYVMAVHDLQHRLQPEFPEVSENGVWAAREYLFRNGAREATLLLADSEVGRQDIIHVYGEFGVTRDRVEVLPFLPASYLAETVSFSEVRRVRENHRLPDRYLFYPAQFWPHKNHARIVEALGLLKRREGASLPLVLSGSFDDDLRRRTFQELMELATRVGVREQVLHLGYVPDEDMSGLYAGAAALVMPTFFGPTNIPVLEAWRLGCVVVTSDIRGIREQVGDAGLLVDPRSVESIAGGIWQAWSDRHRTRQLTSRGREKLAEYGPEHYAERLLTILKKAKRMARMENESVD